MMIIEIIKDCFFMERIQPYLEKLDQILAQNRHLVAFEQATKVKKTIVAIALYFAFTVSVFFGIGASLTTSVFCLALAVDTRLPHVYLFIYGVWASFEALFDKHSTKFFIAKVLLFGWLHFYNGTEIADAMMRNKNKRE
jgi:hypothetical protein